MSASNPLVTDSATTMEDNPHDRAASRWLRLEFWLEKASERLNPILVKEARQALKSNQFAITFTLLLMCAWAWSLLGVTWLAPNMSIGPSGNGMLVGYVYILIVPLLIIVPFSAFRSLAAEREDGTFELVSITTLSARQIVTGKLGSAILQMLIYFSALSPCVAFTYLLRGVDVITILLVLGYSFIISLLLSSFGLLVATITRARHWQVLLSVALILGLVLVTWGWGLGVYGISIEMGVPYDNLEFWMGMLAVFTGAASFFVLFLYAAAGNISFASDNRSTRLRVIMLGQQVLWLGWMMYTWIASGDYEFLWVTLFFAAVYWSIAGALMTGESARLSPRTMRSLPQSFLGRALFTWFNPGSGTGYFFAIANFSCVVVVVCIAAQAARTMNLPGAPPSHDVVWSALITWTYVVTYLGVGRFIVLLLRRYSPSGLLLAFVVHALLNIVGNAFPPMIQAWLSGYYLSDYTPLQVTNWFWSIEQAVSGKIWFQPIVPFVLFASAGITLLINLMLTSVEVNQVRLDTPLRVQQDELELHPERAPKVVRASPWD